MHLVSDCVGAISIETSATMMDELITWVLTLSKWKKRGTRAYSIVVIGEFGQNAERGCEGYVVLG